jgi:hypothetical protein
MNRIFVSILAVVALFIPSGTLPAQQSITVKAGTNITDYFPLKERYRYTGFVKGRAIFNNGTFTESEFNYNILSGAMEFIQKRDTLTIVNAERIKIVVLGADTFYFNRGYLEVLFSEKSNKLAVKQFVKFVDVKKMGAYGMTSSTSAISSYSSISSDGGYHKLTVSEDVVVRKEKEYYLFTPEKGFVLFRKNNLLQSFPGKENEIKQYLKKHKVDYSNGSDLLEVMNFLITI